MDTNANGGCLTPNELWSVEAHRQQAERAIERLIVGHFMTSKARQNAHSVFLDPGDGTGPDKIIKWLSNNSPGNVINRAKMKAGFDAGKYAVPDIVTQREPVASSEFYEIKPKSVNGRREGGRKIDDFMQLVRDFSLRIAPGHEYDPHGAFTLVAGLPFVDGKYKAELKWFQDQPGLILYEICFTRTVRVGGKKVELTDEVLLAIAALIAGLVLVGLKFMPAQQPAGGGIVPGKENKET